MRLVVSELGDTPTPYYRTITNQEGDMLLEAFLNLSQPLAALGKDGLARLDYMPFSLTHGNVPRSPRLNRSNQDYRWRYREEEALKERVERFVMRDWYESSMQRERSRCSAICIGCISLGT